MMTFFSYGWISESNAVSVLIPYVLLVILDEIDRGLRPYRQAPLTTDTCGRLGTKICTLLLSNLLIISDLRKGD